MTDQEKLQQVFRLTIMLSGPRKFQREEIMDRLSISERTVYRYLKTIKNAGFILEQKEGYYWLRKEDPTIKNLNALFHFTEEEMFAIHHLLENAKTLATKKLIKKLHTLYDFKALDRINQKSELVYLDKLKDAIKKKKQVVLCEYRSSNSQKIRDRKVEPFAFLPDYRGVWCFDTEDKITKQFYLSRIKEVQPTEIRWFHQEKHQIPFTDAFRMGAVEAIANVKLQMSLKAYNLLKDEYPVAIQYVSKNGKSYDAEIPVAAFEGIGRFVMGLPGEVKVVGPQTFKEFLKEKAKLFSSLTEFDS